jgi:hypothetical protein
MMTPEAGASSGQANPRRGLLVAGRVIETVVAIHRAHRA